MGKPVVIDLNDRSQTGDGHWLAQRPKPTPQPVEKFDEDQPRDEGGRWTDSGGGSVGHVGHDAGPKDVVRTPEFKQWFQGSKVVDAQGQPLVVYHGTSGDIPEFTAEHLGTNSNVFGPWQTERSGIFFAVDPELAHEFATQGQEPGALGGQSILPVYLSISNPADLRKGVPDAILDGLEARGLNRYYYENLHHDWEVFDHEHGGREFVAALRDMGYDGARLKDISVGDVQNTESWVAFDPAQVKSATGNRGTFERGVGPISKEERRLQARWWAKAIQGVTQKGGEASDQALQQGVLALQKSWTATAKRIAGQARGSMALQALPTIAATGWEAAVEAATPAIVKAIMASVVDLGPAPDPDPLQVLAEGWLDAFGQTMGERRIKPRIERVIASLPEGASREQIGDAIEVALADAILVDAVITLQPLAHRMETMAAIRALSSAKKAAGDPMTAGELAGEDPAQYLVPEDWSLNRNARYRIVTAGDSDVCEICLYLEDLEGGFRVSDALAVFDNFMSALDDGTFEDDLPDATPFPTMNDVEGLGVKKLTALGILVPPFHPHCRCSTELVE